MATLAEQTGNGLGPIESGVSYPLEDFKGRVGQSDWGIRMARRQGLKVRAVGRRKYVLGDDWIAYLTRQDGSAT